MATATADGWAIDEAGFPGSGTLADRLRFVVRYAVLAPSSHNTQPWRFRVTEDAVEVHADPDRRLAVADPEGRETVLSCGAAVFLLRVALRRFGWTDEVEVLPDPANPDHLATVRPGPATQPGKEVLTLFRAIPRRRTYRLPFERREVSAAIAAALLEAAEDEGAVLHPVGGEVALGVADLVARGERVQFADPAFRAELSRWLRSTRETSGDGIPAEALGVPGIFAPVVPGLVARADVGRLLAGRERQAAEEAPLLAVLASENDTPREWIASGQALARVLLVAAAAGVSASFLNQPVQVPPLRQRLRALLATGDAPQAVLRLGYAPECPPTARRELAEVLDG
jgi:nitroreductase